MTPAELKLLIEALGGKSPARLPDVSGCRPEEVEALLRRARDIHCAVPPDPDDPLEEGTWVATPPSQAEAASRERFLAWGEHPEWQHSVASVRKHYEKNIHKLQMELRDFPVVMLFKKRHTLYAACRDAACLLAAVLPQATDPEITTVEDSKPSAIAMKNRLARGGYFRDDPRPGWKRP